MTLKKMYPEGFSTQIDVTAGSGILCDAHRPGHFSGVATVVTKLFLQTGTLYACFGEKDYQQLFKIKRLVTDLNIQIEIVPCPTIREPDGLALSSRNARLTEEDRKIASQLHQAMKQAASKIHDGASADQACTPAIEELNQSTPFNVEYMELRSAHTLETLEYFEPDCRLFAAAWLGDVRLIDNIAV